MAGEPSDPPASSGAFDRPRPSFRQSALLECDPPESFKACARQEGPVGRELQLVSLGSHWVLRGETDGLNRLQTPSADRLSSRRNRNTLCMRQSARYVPAPVENLLPAQALTLRSPSAFSRLGQRTSAIVRPAPITISPPRHYHRCHSCGLVPAPSATALRSSHGFRRPTASSGWARRKEHLAA